MELRQIKTFRTVSQLLSFNRAAETLNYAQSTVSAQIKALEDEFDKPLFDRLGKRIVLTEAGKILDKYARKILAIEEETVTQVTGWEESQGSITIRIPQSLGIYFLPAVLKEFNDLFPKVGFDINSCALTIQHELRSGIVDLAFLLTDSIHAADLQAEMLDTERIVMVSNPDHPLANRSSVNLDDLADVSILLPKQD